MNILETFRYSQPTSEKHLILDLKKLLVGQQPFGQNCDLNTNLQVPLKIKVKIKTWKYDIFPCILCKKFQSNLAWICQLRSMNEKFYTFFKKTKNLP